MAKQYWQVLENAICWQVKEGEVHQDNIEMSGLYCDDIVHYGVQEDGSLLLHQVIYYPMLRTIPNDTHATFSFPLAQNERITLQKNGKEVIEYPASFLLDGRLTVLSDTKEGFSVRRCFFPSTDTPFALELVTLQATEDVTLTLSHPAETIHSYGRGTKGVYVCKIFHDAPETIALQKGEAFTFAIYYLAHIANQTYTLPDPAAEEEKRLCRIKELCDDNLVLETDNKELDTMTRFAKLRAGESIFETLTGKYHSPGGRTYYAATWCNDQAEYVGPHAAMTGDAVSIEAAINAYKSYTAFMSDSYHKLPSSIIAEGLDIWEGVGDRGDAAMYLYGCSLFCLYLGDEQVARELYPAIRWCAEYCHRRKSPEGVICSDTDELENRFPTDGKANLSTSSLCYGGLLFASRLADSLGDHQTADCYRRRAEELAAAIEAYFGANLHGFDTYRYSKGYHTLRAWICLPLCMGIQERAKGTLDAMLSSYLWTEEGMLSCERSDENPFDTLWDRATLYGMKCAFLCGLGDRMIDPLLAYCHKRLVCDRVPYAVEAYPEGDKRHLSGESALFVRAVTEGMFAIRPESLTGFSFVPSLPRGLSFMNLRKIPVAGATFDIEIAKDGWKVLREGEVVAFGADLGHRVEI